jgi:hypothetical protein
MMKNWVPERRFPAQREKCERCSPIHATRLDSVFFAL